MARSHIGSAGGFCPMAWCAVARCPPPGLAGPAARGSPRCAGLSGVRMGPAPREPGGGSERKTRARRAAYGILAATVAFALAQAPTWQALVTQELHRAEAASVMSASPSLRQEALDKIYENFARPFPPPLPLPSAASPAPVPLSILEQYVASLQDRYTRIVGQAELQELADAFGSIPLVLRQHGGSLFVAESGVNGEGGRIVAGDRVTSIQGVSTEGMSVFAAADLIESTPSPLKFGIEPVAGDATLGTVSVSVQKKPPAPRDVEFALRRAGDMRVGYLRVHKFTAGVSSAVAAAVDSASDDADVWVLDLRGNSGGLIREAQRLAGVFLGDEHTLVRVAAKGVVSSLPTLLPTEWSQSGGRADETSREVSLDKGVVVVVDQASASASEFVAVALEEGRGALVVGKRSRGKALAQVCRQHFASCGWHLRARTGRR